MKLFLTLLFFIVFVMGQAESKSLIPESFSASFEESFKKAATGKEKKYFGKLDYKYPGNFRREISTPAEEAQVFVSNPSKSWLYQAPFVSTEKGTVTIQKSGSLPLTKVFDAIKTGIDNSKIFTSTYSEKNIVLTFNQEMQKETTIKSVTLQAIKDAKSVEGIKDFDRIILEKVDGTKTNIKLSDVKENVSFESSHFTFKVPENTRVTTN